MKNYNQLTQTERYQIYALRKANKKFKKRFHLLESHVSKSGREIEDFSINELNKIWDLTKKS